VLAKVVAKIGELEKAFPEAKKIPAVPKLPGSLEPVARQDKRPEDYGENRLVKDDGKAFAEEIANAGGVREFTANIWQHQVEQHGAQMRAFEGLPVGADQRRVIRELTDRTKEVCQLWRILKLREQARQAENWEQAWVQANVRLMSDWELVKANKNTRFYKRILGGVVVGGAVGLAAVALAPAAVVYGMNAANATLAAAEATLAAATTPAEVAAAKAAIDVAAAAIVTTKGIFVAGTTVVGGVAGYGVHCAKN
jgi:hypothetical protein